MKVKEIIQGPLQRGSYKEQCECMNTTAGRFGRQRASVTSASSWETESPCLVQESLKDCPVRETELTEITSLHPNREKNAVLGIGNLDPPSEVVEVLLAWLVLFRQAKNPV